MPRELTWTDTLDARYAVRKAPLLLTAFATLGIVYGDIGTSPLYVMNGIFPPTGPVPSEEDVLGAISTIVWSLLLVPLVKYSLIVLEFGTGDGEGGPFALYSQLYPREKPGSELTLPTMHTGSSRSEASNHFLTHKGVKTCIHGITFFATGMILSDGILTPAVSVVSAVGGIAVAVPSVTGAITGISVAVLVVLFLAQTFGTSKLSVAFSPIVFIWLGLLGGTGIANITTHPGIFRAFDPSRAVLWFVRLGNAWPLSGVLLCITGVEALFANLGQFSKGAIRLGFSGYAYPCLTLAYLGQGARLIVDGPNVVPNVFYNSIPGGTGTALWWLTWAFGILATIVASQAMITASFSLIQQMVSLDSFPPVRIHHTSNTHRGQIYAPVVNILLMIGCIGVTLGFGTDTNLTNAYGFAVSSVLFMTTFLLTLVMINVRHYFILVPAAFLVFFGFIDALFFVANSRKVPDGAWFTLTLGVALAGFLAFWTWGKGLEDAFDAAHRTRLSKLFSRHVPEEEAPGESHPLLNREPTVDGVSDGIEKGPASHPLAPTDDAADASAAAAAKVRIVDPVKEKPTTLQLETAGGPVDLTRANTFTFFHHLGGGGGAPHSFTAFVNYTRSVPRVVVFLSIRFVNAAHLDEEDKYLLDRIRTLDGFYIMTLRLGYRDHVDLRNLIQPTLRRIIALERGTTMPGMDPALDSRIAEILLAANTDTQILPGYDVTSKGFQTRYRWPRIAVSWLRKFLLEEVFRRVEQNFPETSGYEMDPGKVLRIGVNAEI